MSSPTRVTLKAPSLTKGCEDDDDDDEDKDDEGACDALLRGDRTLCEVFSTLISLSLRSSSAIRFYMGRILLLNLLVSVVQAITPLPSSINALKVVSIALVLIPPPIFST